MANKKIILSIMGLVILIFIILWIIPKQSTPKTKAADTASPQPNQTDKPQIVSTKPENLEESIISASEVVEITFNRPLENSGEFKVRIEPKIDFKVELSGDRKTAKIIPLKPYELGTTYTLFIGTETKFDGVGRWGEEKIFHFRTIKYRGI